MNCDQARNLFDAYLDGELSPALGTEFDAHRIDCEDCRRKLALLEVVEHVVAAEGQEPEGLCDGFTDRLMACLDRPRPRASWLRDRRWLYLGAPLAAAAVIAFLMYGPLSPSGSHHILGKEDRSETTPPDADQRTGPDDIQADWQMWLQELHNQLSQDRLNMDSLKRDLKDEARGWIESAVPAPQDDAAAAVEDRAAEPPIEGEGGIQP